MQKYAKRSKCVKRYGKECKTIKKCTKVQTEHKKETVQTVIRPFHLIHQNHIYWLCFVGGAVLPLWAVLAVFAILAVLTVMAVMAVLAVVAALTVFAVLAL